MLSNDTICAVALSRAARMAAFAVSLSAWILASAWRFSSRKRSRSASARCACSRASSCSEKNWLCSTTKRVSQYSRASSASIGQPAGSRERMPDASPQRSRRVGRRKIWEMWGDIWGYLGDMGRSRTWDRGRYLVV